MKKQKIKTQKIKNKKKCFFYNDIKTKKQNMY